MGKTLRSVLILALLGAAVWYAESRRRAGPDLMHVEVRHSTAAADAPDAALDSVEQELVRLRGLPIEKDAEFIAHVERILRELTDDKKRAKVGCELAVRLNNRATRAMKDDDERTADLDSKRALELCPSEPVLKKNRSAMLRSFANKEDRKTEDGRRRARERLEAALALDANPDTSVALAEMAYADNDVAGAVKLYDQALAAQGNPAWQARREELSKKAAVEGTFSDRRHQHFVARFEGYAQEKLAWLALDALEEAYFSIGRSLDLHPAEPFTVIIYTGDQYARAINVPDWTSGVFDGKIRIAEGQLALEKGSLEKILRHEYTHAALSTVPTRIPVWMNEGIAEYFEGSSADGAQQECERQAREGHTLSWSELNTPFVEFKDKDKARLAYASATALVGGLIASRGAYSLVTFVTGLETGSTFEQAFGSAFGIQPQPHFDAWTAALD